MTAGCTGGTSAPKAGHAAVIEYSAGAIALVLASRGLGWLTPVIPLLGLTSLTLAAFCATDPPASPTFTSAEATALLGLKFGADFDSGLAKARDLAYYSIWNEICECTSGTPVAPTYPAAPSGTPIFLPPPSPTVQPCASYLYTDANCDLGTLNKAGPAGTVGQFPTLAVLHMVGTDCGAGVGAGHFNWIWTFRGQDGTALSTVTFSLIGTQTADVSVVCPTGTKTLSLNHVQTSGARGQQVVGTTFDLYCGGQTPGTQTPCCPPDQSTQAYLDLLVKMVTLIQRQSVPFAYVPGTVHSGLSGAGTLSVSGLIGVKVVLTSDPATLGVAGTAPPELFDRGFITWGTPDGYPHSVRIEHNPQLSLPARASVFTDLAYDLHPGVVATITELLREP